MGQKKLPAQNLLLTSRVVWGVFSYYFYFNTFQSFKGLLPWQSGYKVGDTVTSPYAKITARELEQALANLMGETLELAGSIE